MGLLSTLVGRWIGHALVKLDEWYGVNEDIKKSSISYYKKNGKWPSFLSAHEIKKARERMEKTDRRNKWK